jgi:prophage DNA circulation protein
VTIGITTGRKVGLSVSQIGGSGGAGASGAATALSDVAGRVAAALASELRLAQDAGSHQSSGGGGDPYAIDELSRELASRLGGSTADAGHIARALHEFATESASLIGARPDSRSFIQIEAAIAPVDGNTAAAETVQGAIRMIEQSTARVKSGS